MVGDTFLLNGNLSFKLGKNLLETTPNNSPPDNEAAKLQYVLKFIVFYQICAQLSLSHVKQTLRYSPKCF